MAHGFLCTDSDGHGDRDRDRDGRFGIISEDMYGRERSTGITCKYIVCVYVAGRVGRE